MPDSYPALSKNGIIQPHLRAGVRTWIITHLYKNSEFADIFGFETVANYLKIGRFSIMRQTILHGIIIA